MAGIKESINSFASTTEYREFLDETYENNQCYKYKISVIICRYNTPYDLLFRSIRSVLECSHYNVEVIVVDDGSKVSSERAVHHEFNHDERIKVYYKDNTGLGLSRNFGVEKASGEYVFYLDSDDTVEVNGLKRMLAHAIYYDVQLVMGKRVNCDETGLPLKEANRGLYGETFRIMYKDDINNVFNDQMVNNKLIKRSALYKYNIWFKAGLYEDIEYSAMLYNNIAEYHYTNIHIHNWYKYGENTTISSNTSVNNLEERIDKLEKAWEITPEFRRKRRIKYIIQNEFINYLRAFYYMREEEQLKVWSLLQSFIQPKLSYIQIKKFEGRSKKLARALYDCKHDKFVEVVKKYYYIDKSSIPHYNYVACTKEQVYYSYLHAKKNGIAARLFINDEKEAISDNYIKRQKKEGVFSKIKRFENGDVMQRLDDAVKKCPEDEYSLKPTFLFSKYKEVFENCNMKKDKIFVFSKDEPWWYYVHREFKNVCIVKLTLIKRIKVLIFRINSKLKRM